VPLLPCCCAAAVFVSYAVVSLTDAVLYTNPGKVTPAVAAHLQEGGVVVRPYDQLVPDIKAKAAQGTKIAMDLARVSVFVGGGGWAQGGGGCMDSAAVCCTTAHCVVYCMPCAVAVVLPNYELPPAAPCHADLRGAITCCNVLCHANSCCVMLTHDASCRVVLCPAAGELCSVPGS
jgi:acetyl esterase/lipase